MLERGFVFGVGVFGSTAVSRVEVSASGAGAIAGGVRSHAEWVSTSPADFMCPPDPAPPMVGGDEEEGRRGLIWVCLGATRALDDVRSFDSLSRERSGG